MTAYSTGEINVTSPAGAVALRSQLVNAIEGGPVMVAPTQYVIDDQPQHGGNGPAYFGRSPMFSKWLAYHWGTGPYQGVQARTYFASFYSNAKCLVVFNAGHYQGFFSAADLNNPSGARDFVRRAVNEQHCDVVLSSLPFMGENTGMATYIGYPTAPGNIHDLLGNLTLPAGTPLRYWIDAVYGSISYALSRKSYDKIVVVGLSGGGFVTTLLAALDPRITESHAVAGSVPIGARRMQDSGDWEQKDAIYNLGIDYPDLYLLGTVDANGQPTRKAYLYYGSDDSCCFDRSGYNGFAFWLRQYASEHGFDKSLFRIFVSFTANHDVTPDAAEVIIQSIASPAP